MTAKLITDTLALAAYDLAEAETAILAAEHDLRQARRRQVAAIGLLADLHAQIKSAVKTIHIKDTAA